MNFWGHNYSSSTCVTFQSLQMSHLLLLAKVAADSQWLKWGQKLITYPENCHNKSWFPSHCPFSSNLLHGQILQKISVQQSGSKDAGFEGGLFQKVFKGYIFCFLGHLVGGKLFELFARETKKKKRSVICLKTSFATNFYGTYIRWGLKEQGHY